MDSFALPGSCAAVPMAPRRHTTRPIVTGTSVLAIKFDKGILLGSDTLLSYGSLARFRDIRRVHQVGDSIIGAGGEFSDFQKMRDMFDDEVRSNAVRNDGITLRTKALHAMLTRVMYNRRNKFNPFYNSVVVGGFEDDDKTPYLGYVDSIGTAFSDNYITTGFGSHLALPLLRSHWKPNMSKGDALRLLKECLRVLYYRDCRTMNRIRFASVEKDEAGITRVLIEKPEILDTKWDFKAFVKPKAGGDTDGSW